MVTETKKRWNLRPGGDIVLWIIAVVLAVVSLLVVYSSTGTSVVATSGNHFGVFIHQLGIVVMGLVVIYLVHKVNYQSYGRVVWAAYTIALVFAVLVYFIGEESGDAVRRMRIPLINFTFQPSDFLKVATVMVVARELARRQKTISTEPVTPPFTPRGWRKKNGRKILLDTTMPLFMPVVVSFVAIFPANLSTAVILFGTCLVMMFIGRVRIRDLTKFVVVFTLCGALTIGFLYAIGHPPKRMKTWVGRVERFFDVGDHSKMSEAEKQREADMNYQVDQAKIAIAAGRVRGAGGGGRFSARTFRWPRATTPTHSSSRSTAPSSAGWGGCCCICGSFSGRYSSSESAARPFRVCSCWGWDCSSRCKPSST